MPRILSHTLLNRRHRRHQLGTLSSAFSPMTSMSVSSDDERHENNNSPSSRNVRMSHWPATVTPPSTSPSSSMTTSTLRNEESFSTRPPITKRRRVLSVSATEDQDCDIGASEDWGHFVDVEEEEEKIVRHSRILSRGSSFASVVSESGGDFISGLSRVGC
mmetsp:Transcript_14579/g.26411  ORF Transcript_14579/g.26411 Transcript_14579/m.26411 type:complete len:161 (-) Transcript_14579:48-530(-)